MSKQNWLRIPPPAASKRYPWTVSRACRKCGGINDVTPRRWRCIRAWKDRRDVLWAGYACPQGHQEYWTVTVQVYEQLTGRDERKWSNR